MVHRGTGTPNWELIRRSLPELLAAIAAATPTGARAGLAERHKLAFYKPLIESLSLETCAAAEDETRAEH